MKHIQLIKRLATGFIAAAFILPLVACQPNDQAMKDFFEKNPEVLQAQIEKVLKEKGIRGKPRQKSLAERMKNPIKVGLNNAYTMGPDDAPITIIEFSDFQCPFCSRVIPTMKKLVKDYNGKVRFAFRHHPLSFHKNAMSAAKASLAAGEQGKFWEMHDKLFENQRQLTDPNIEKLAKDLKLDIAKFKKAWKSNKYDAQIQKDIQFARSNGASGTPAFFVNGVYMKGAQPYASFKQLIDKLLEQKKKS